MGSDMFLNPPRREGDVIGMRERDEEIIRLNARLNEALQRAADLREERDRLRLTVDRMVSGEPLPPGYKSPVEQLVEQMEALREDNARLIRAVCALAEGEVKRSEVSDE